MKNARPLNISISAVLAPTAIAQPICDPLSIYLPAPTIAVATTPRSIAIADLNDDALPDLVTANEFTGDVSVIIATSIDQPTPTYAAAEHFTAGLAPQSVAIADFNNDARPDLAIANLDGSNVTILLNTTAPGGPITFDGPFAFDAGLGPVFLVAIDLDNDNDNDLAVANLISNDISVLVNTTDDPAVPSFETLPPLPVGRFPSAIAAADLNADNRPDLITANLLNASVSILLNTTAQQPAAPSFAPEQRLAVGDQPLGVTAADVDLDDDHDLLVANFASNDLSLLINNAGASFAPDLRLPAGLSPYATAVADFNGDATPDIATANFNDDTITLLLSNASPATLPTASAPTYDPPAAIHTPGGPYSLALADLDDDRDPDLAVALANTDRARVLINVCGPFPPIIIEHPISRTAAVGDPPQLFNVVAAYADNYQWRRNASDLTPSLVVSGPTTPTLTLVPTPTTEGTIDVVLTNPFGTITSQPAYMPVLTDCPADQNNDGILTGADFNAFLTNFAAGCP